MLHPLTGYILGVEEALLDVGSVVVRLRTHADVLTSLLYCVARLLHVATLSLLVAVDV